MKFEIVKIETFIPEDYIEKLMDKLNDIGALTIDGIYDYCISISKVQGSWRPLHGAEPYNGKIGEICKAEELKVEFCCRIEMYEKAVETIKRVHPYERPVINVIPLIG